MESVPEFEIPVCIAQIWAPRAEMARFMNLEYIWIKRTYLDF